MFHLQLSAQQKIMLKVVVFGGTFVGLVSSTTVSVWRASLVVLAMYVATGGWKFANVVARTVVRDLKYVFLFLFFLFLFPL